MLNTIKRILKIAGNCKYRILAGILLNFLKTVSMGFMIMAVYTVVHHLGHLSTNIILKSLGILLLSIGGRFLFQWLMDICMSAEGFEMFRNYRLSIGERMRKAPMGYFSEQRLGSIQTVLTSTVNELEQYSMLAIMDMTGGVLMTVVMMFLFLFFQPVFSLITLFGLAMGMLVLHIIQKAAIIHTPNVLKAQEHMTTQALEYIRGISVLRAFSNTEHSEEAVYEAFDRKRSADLKQEYASLPLLKIYQGVYKLTGCILMFTSVALYISSQIPLDYCLMFIVSAFIVYSEMEQMGDGAFLARKIATELNRLETVTDMPEMDTTDAKIQPESFDLSLQDVSFGYDKRRILNHISLKIPQGTTCAIVGPSGSGKTTLCNLIARFWDVSEGHIFVGKSDIRNYTADSWMHYISMVFQNVYLFQDTIANNIRFGNPDATMEQVVAAAKRAQCHEFITALPEGYDTMIGEGGSTLSGGERQRISIARAILKDAPIIILDEATSSVDPENEHELLSAIQELTRNKTLISIAHRLTTVRTADQIIVINQGGIEQRGTHAELMKEDGTYERFWRQREEAVGWQL